MSSHENVHAQDSSLLTRGEFLHDIATVVLSPSVGRLVSTVGGGLALHKAYETYDQFIEPIRWGFNPSELSKFPVMRTMANMGDLRRGTFIRWGDSMALGDEGGIGMWIVKKMTEAEPESHWNSVDGYAESGITTQKVLSGFSDPESFKRIVKELKGKPNISIGFSAAGNNLLELFADKKLQGLITKSIDSMPTRRSDLRRTETLQWYMATIGILSDFRRVTKEVKNDTKKILQGFIDLKRAGVDIRRVFVHSLLNEQYAPQVIIPGAPDITIAGDANKERAAKLVTQHLNAAVAEAASSMINNTSGLQIIGVDFFNGIPIPVLSNIHPSRETQARMADVLLSKCHSPKPYVNLLDYANQRIRENEIGVLPRAT